VQLEHWRGAAGAVEGCSWSSGGKVPRTVLAEQTPHLADMSCHIARSRFDMLAGSINTALHRSAGDGVCVMCALCSYQVQSGCTNKVHGL
jgi:hypothetical protein